MGSGPREVESLRTGRRRFLRGAVAAALLPLLARLSPRRWEAARSAPARGGGARGREARHWERIG